MKFKSIRIQNYKCIVDTGVFTLDDVTCLVGKNEAGKTATLEALYKLNPVVSDVKFNELLDYPIHRWSEYQEVKDKHPDNVLTTVWELEETDIENLETKLGKGIVQNTQIKVSKGYTNTRFWEIPIDENLVILHFLDNSNLHTEERQKYEDASSIKELMNRIENVNDTSEREKLLFQTLMEIFPKKEVIMGAASILLTTFPKFLYYPDYEKLPGNVSINDMNSKKEAGNFQFKDRLFIALLQLANTTLEEINEVGKYEELVRTLEATSNRISSEIVKYWSQNDNLAVQFDFREGLPKDPAPFNSGMVFRTRIRNNLYKITVNFDERSTGFIWFFSFLIWFSQIKSNIGDNLVILLDEPGLGLHAKAQSDLLRYITERLEPNYQVIYSTHSPFMIDTSNFHRSRVIQDKSTRTEIIGTKISNKILSVDGPTLFPLQAALGYDITQSLFIGQHSLLVEGPSDVAYLIWFRNELNFHNRPSLDIRWTVIPCNGVDKIPGFISLFSGNKLHIAVFVDFHKPIKATVRNLRDHELLEKDHVLSAEMFVSGDEADDEDMMTRPFYIRLVNDAYNLTGRNKIPLKKPSNAPDRVLKEAEEKINSIVGPTPSFSHLVPAEYLINQDPVDIRKYTGYNEALDNFQSLFDTLNKLF